MLVANSTTTFTLLWLHWLRVAAVIAIIALVECGNDYVSYDRPVFAMSSLAIVVTALSIFLGFRVNEAYARRWEARMLCASITNSSRSFARQFTTLSLPRSDEEGERVEIDAFGQMILDRTMENLHDQNPFDNRPNDTPMTTLCHSIEIDLRQQLGEKGVPAPLQPVNDVLM